MNDPSSRMQLRGTGDLLHPGCCAVCGNGTCEEGYVDLGVYYDYEGQLYLCMNCINKDLVEAVGLLTKDEVEVLLNQDRELVSKNKELTESLEKANERLSHYDNLLAKSFSDLPIVAADTAEQPDDESIDEFQHRDEQSVSESTSERESTNSELSESSPSEGHNDTSGSTTGSFEL